jgi:hypothetical protein
MWIRTDHEQNAKNELRRDYRALGASGRVGEARGHCGAGAVVDMAGRIAYGEGLRSQTDSKNAPYT